VSKSLQDQLMALGLAKEKVREKVRGKVREKTRQTPDQKPHFQKRSAAKKPEPAHPAAKRVSESAANAKSADDISLEQAYRIRESEEKSEKQKARERKMEEDRKRAVLNKQIRQIIDQHRLNLAEADEARYFLYKDRIRKVHVTAEQLLQMNEGKLGVVYLAGGYHLLSGEHIEAVRKLSPAHVPDLLAGADDDEELWAAFEKSASEVANGQPSAAVIDQASELDDQSGDPQAD